MATDWSISTVDDVRRQTSGGLATGPFGSSVSAKFFRTHGIPLIRGSNLSADVGKRLVEDNYVFVSEEKAAEFPRAVAERGDLIFTCWGTIGQVGLIDKHARFDRYLISNKQMKLSPDPEKADSLFLYYLFSSPKLQSMIESIGIGSSVPGFNLGQLRSLQFQLPSPSEQRAIANVLGLLDDRIMQIRDTCRTIERMARLIFQAWFVNFEPVHAKVARATCFPSMPQKVFDSLPERFVDSGIGPIPEGWSVDSLRGCCQIISGGTPKRSEPSYWNGAIPWYSVKDVPDEGEVWTIATNEHVTERGLAESAAVLLDEGGTIISARGTVGKLAMAGVPMAFNQSCYGLLPKKTLGRAHVYLMLRYVAGELMQRTHGSVFETITRDTFAGVLTVVAPAEVSKAFESIAWPLLDAIRSMRWEEQSLGQLRDYLLPRLLNGSVSVEVPNG